MRTVRMGLIVGTLVGLAIVGYLAATYYLEDVRMGPTRPAIHIRPPSPEELQTYFTAKTIISMMNAGLSAIVLIVYAEIYVRTRAQFTIGLVILSAALFIYAVMSNPLLHALSFQVYGIGLVSALPDLFTTVATVVLLYLSME